VEELQQGRAQPEEVRGLRSVLEEHYLGGLKGGPEKIQEYPSM